MSHHNIVNAVLDRVIDTREAVDAAIERSAPTRAGLRRVLHKAFERGSTPDEFRLVFLRAVLAEVAQSTPDVLARSRANLGALVAALNEEGPSEARTIPALRKPDVMARAAERAATKENDDGQA